MSKFYFVLTTILMIVGLIFSSQVNARTLESECQKYKVKVGTSLKKIDLNKASENDLLALPGIGIKTARAIMDHRKAIGGFKSMEQLQRVRGIGDEVYKCLKDIVTVSQ